MPRYEYKCDKCGESWERVRPIIDTVSQDACPRCKVMSKQVIRGGGGIHGFAQYDESESAFDGLV